MTRFTDRVERDLRQISEQATPSSTAWEAIRQRIDEQDTTEPTMEVIMLAPDPNKPNTRNRLWVLAAAAAIVAVAVIGTLIAGNGGDESPVITDQPDTPVDQDPAPDEASQPNVADVTIGLALPVTVPYLDYDFELQDVFASRLLDDTSAEEDDDPDTDYVQVLFEITNPTVDFEVRGAPMRNLVRLSVPGLGQPVTAERVWDGDHERSSAPFGPGPEQSVVRQWSFPVPAGTDPSAATLVIALDGGADPSRPQTIPLAGPAPVEPEAEVTLAETTFGGPYSTNAVDFVVVDSFASFNRGMYDDNRARHAGSIDRRAEVGEVFVVIELQADSTDGVGGVQPGEHAIITDGGVENLCQSDAPETYGEETVVYSVTCAVPVASSTFTFQMSSDKCVDGCTSIDHQIAIDPSFTEAFE